MSGLFRNFLTIVWALWRYNSVSPQSRTSAWFFVTPFDTGIATLKSDKYLQLAESAQVDYMLQTGLIKKTLGSGYNFVNAAQMVKFIKPIRLFKRVRVETQVVFADSKCVWFSHRFFVGETRHAEVLVKMKFKKGPVTVAPRLLVGAFRGAKPSWADHWDDALAAWS
ncbi:thioesterase family protein [Polaromonas sp.]|uniref:acyl-CoA thioesterase n=1 Tax=Polaromonas sp. TaxID=1869339 RepID=UPI0027318890|nr:thioesterase family protein [Polaromonas sp.]MDP1739820.1 thioesterase family protein [Polaromonas sp.]